MSEIHATNPFKLLDMQIVVDDLLDWIRENEPSFFDGVSNADELTTRLMIHTPPPEDLKKETILPLVENWWDEGRRQ